MYDELLYLINPGTYDDQGLLELLDKHPEIKFVSLVAVDLGNNHTDEKIPIELFKEDIADFLVKGVQTDGSSVVLPEIADLSNAKVDLIPDKDVRWFIDYNYDLTDPSTSLPVGTLIIPAFLCHEDKLVCSRSVLKRSAECLKENLMGLFKTNSKLLEEFGIESADMIDEVLLTTATELEFWVKTPGKQADIEKLSTSQVLKEQYWKRTIGPVKTALEESLLKLNKYGFEVEMGHKEVGGVPSAMDSDGNFTYIMEQLEIDWKYSSEMQTGDNEMFAQDIIKDTFVDKNLDVTFLAKPIEGVAGNGKHTHIGLALKLKSGKMLNLFSPLDPKSSYMSSLGFESIMGLLKNYEVVNPFISNTNDALRRLKPGFEAPVCIVTSLGHTVETPSRNRTILAGLIRDMNNPMATRFEVRSPNPTTNTYVSVAAIYQAMLDGILKISASDLTLTDIEKELSKKPGDDAFYLEKDRAYRSEEDVFEDYTDEERDSMFGVPPATVYENVKALDLYPDKVEVLLNGGVFTEDIIKSLKTASTCQWINELKSRILDANTELVRASKKLHDIENATDYDVVNWEKINQLRHDLMKNKLSKKSLFEELRSAIEESDFETVSRLQVEMQIKMAELEKLYSVYKRNLFGIK
ncbi:MAG: glutamine synthetase [Clostridiales bacterium]|nr:MAG: glutamine synthetase [Clostridiales bacterium]